MLTAIPRSRFFQYSAIVILAVAASATGLRNGFALDDVALVAANEQVHTLHGWWQLFAHPYWPPQFGASLYRPVVTLGFALQWTAGYGATWVFHLSSIALYAVASALVLALFRLVLPADAAFVGAALFAAHPVHVEAVANVVGQSELVAAVATIAAGVLYVRRRRAGTLSPSSIGWIALLFAAACLSKEQGVLLPALLIALELLAVPPPSSTSAAGVRERIRIVAPLFIVLGTIAVAYITARTVVVGDALGEKHLVPVDGVDRLWVLLAIAPHWVRLLAWPAHLAADYSPHHIDIPDGPGVDVVVGFIVLTAATALFVALGSNRSSSYTGRRSARLGMVIAAIALLPVSNLFSVMLVAERTLFLPSVGAMLVVGALASHVLHPDTERAGTGVGRAAIASATAVMVALGVVRSSQRQLVWRDDQTLFEQTVKDAPSSYRAQFFYGQLLFDQGRRAEGERHLRLAIALNPTASDVSPLNYLATQYRDAGMCAQALPLYERAIANDAERPDVRYGLASCLLETGKLEDARRIATEGVRRGDLRSLFLQLIARSDSVAAHRS